MLLSWFLACEKDLIFELKLRAKMRSEKIKRRRELRILIISHHKGELRLDQAMSLRYNLFMDQSKQNSEFSWLTASGEMAQRMREKDWSKSKLGPPHKWPIGLKTSLNICLGSKHPLFIWWGEDLHVFYNDAYIQIAGPEKHPMFIGSRAKDMWSEIWDVVGPLAQHVLDTGEGTWNEDLPLFMQRKGYLEETYFSFSYSPARDEHGLIQGIFCACQETTDRVLHERRLNTLRELSVKKFHSEWEAAQEFAQALSNNSWDITFLLILLKDRNTGRVLIRDGFGIDIQKASERLRDVVFSFESPTLITGLREKYFDFLPSDPWPEKSNSAYIMPMDGFGYLVYGVSPRLEFNTSYEGFLELASQSITNGFREVERERIILDNEERLNLVFKSSEIGFWDWDYKTGEVLVNEQFKHDWGIETQGNLTNQNEIYVKIHPDDLEKIRSEFASAQRENRNYEVEYRILRTPQEILWIYAKGKIYFDQEGVPARMTGTSVNVTPQRKLNDALKTSENEFRSLVESLPGIVWISDSSGKVTWYNRNWYEYTGLKFEESWEKVVHPEDILSLKEKTGTTQFEYRIRRESDGMYRWHVGRSIPIRDADGLVIRQIGARDRKSVV